MRHKFTLIELLIVVAIIGILASLLHPSLSRARVSAKRAVCKAHLNQSGKIMYMYGQDNSFTLYDIKSGAFTLTKGADNRRIWDAYQPYSDAIYQAWGCPMFDDRPIYTSDHTNHPHIAGVDIIYGGENFSDIKMSKQNSDTVMVQDLVYKYKGYWRSNHSEASEWKVYQEVNAYKNSPGYVFTRDATPYGANISYGDGHTKFVRLSGMTQIGAAGGLYLWSTVP